MMKMSRSPYIDSVDLTVNHSGRRTHKVQAFVIHHMAAKWTGKRCSKYFQNPKVQASANYNIGYNGDVSLNVEERNRAWTSSSAWADNRAITLELANSSMGHPWPVGNTTMRKAILVLADLHKRYGLKKASYTGDTKGTLWRHDWWASTNCPGPYLGGMLSYMADEINKILMKESVEMSSNLPSDWARTPWYWGVGKGLISENRPKDAIRRQEALDVLYKYDRMNRGGEPSDWAKEAWDWTKQRGYLNGENPHKEITREEIAVVLKRFADSNNLK